MSALNSPGRSLLRWGTLPLLPSPSRSTWRNGAAGSSRKPGSVSRLEVVSLPNGQFAENCYVVADATTGEAVIIDPGQEPATFLAALEDRGWALRSIWLTHGHIDHIMGVGAVQQATGA